MDLTELAKKNPYQLTDEQQKQIIKDIYHNDYNKYYDYELAISEFSIDLHSKSKFVIAYRKLTLDPVKKTLHANSKTQFNSNFYIKDVKHSLSYYTDLSPADFEAIYIKDKSEALELFGNSPVSKLARNNSKASDLSFM